MVKFEIKKIRLFVFKKSNKKLYTKILIWAFKKQESGFKWKDLELEFDLDVHKSQWIRKIFLTTSDNDRKFFENFGRYLH